MGFIDVQYNLSLDGHTIHTIADHLSAHLFRISTFTNFEEKSTAIGTTFTPLHSILYMAGLEERVLEGIKQQQRNGRGILMKYILFRNIEKIDTLRQCNETVNGFHLIIKFTAE